MKKTLASLLVIAVVGFGGYFLMRDSSDKTPTSPEKSETTTDTLKPADNTPKEETAQIDKTKTVIGTSVGGNNITAYHFGTGESELLFIGGIHGGYEWNTALVAYELMDYLKENPAIIPANVTVTVIPVFNPDGLKKVVGTTERFTPTDVSALSETVIAGRFNANDVDLNRNFDCDWQASGKWQTKTVSGGSSAFSEPESQAMKNYVETNKPTAVIVWYSAAGGVFASSCHNGVSTETNVITKKFADVSGYPAYQSFDFYATTGDMVNWLAKNNIPAISVLLTNHTDTEWAKNKAGVDALLKYYTK
ncbi:MAG: M14 family zinc carboxypeptidase [bacterium]|nr:M14 family zinc carboxypeptidase [bacterium]